MFDTGTCIYAMSAAESFEPRLPSQDCVVSVVVLGGTRMEPAGNITDCMGTVAYGVQNRPQGDGWNVSLPNALLTPAL